MTLELAEGEDGWQQSFAGGLLWTHEPLMAGASRASRPEHLGTHDARGADWSPVYDGPALVDGGLHSLRSLLSSHGERRVEYEDGECFVVDAAGARVRRASSNPADARTRERALGAPMALALALRGVFLLHASAVTRRNPKGEFGGAIAFTAASGGGKSTLAAAAARSPDNLWRRLADDQLPVRLGEPATALPHFPQLKLLREEAYPAGAPAELPLVALIEIVHAPQYLSIDIGRLDATSACLALLRATVATKLFDPALLGQHFRACASASRWLPVHRLSYPTGFAHLEAVLAEIVEALQAAPQ